MSPPAAEAESRMLRLICAVLGIATIVALVSVLQNAVAQISDFELWWTLLAVAAAALLPLVLTGASRFASTRALRLIAGILAVTFLAALVGLGAGLAAGPLPPQVNAPWILGIAPIATIAAALAASPPVAWAYCGATAVLVAFDRMIAYPNDIVLVAIQDALVSLLVQAVFTALVLVSLATARTLDRVAHQTRSDVTDRAVIAARHRERMHASALVHDHVLATLILGSRDDGHVRSTVSEHARNSLHAIARFTEPRRASTVKPLDLAWMLQATTTDIAPFASFEYADEPGCDDIPLTVAEALTEATAEALRNSINHAGGPDVERAVTVDLDRSGCRVAIMDDGTGFDPLAVPESRLGISVSITGRLALIPGGRTQIASRPGAGTVVSIEWNVHERD